MAEKKVQELSEYVIMVPKPTVMCSGLKIPPRYRGRWTRQNSANPGKDSVRLPSQWVPHLLIYHGCAVDHLHDEKEKEMEKGQSWWVEKGT